jgi:hypothetical protein
MAQAIPGQAPTPQGAPSGGKPNVAQRTGAVIPDPLEPGQLGKSLDRLSKDEAAIAKHGSYDEAVEAGYRFKGQQESFIPWQKLTTPEGSRAWIGQVLDAASPHVAAVKGGKKKGVMTDAEVEASVAKMAKVWGDNPTEILGIVRSAGDAGREMVKRMELATLLGNRAFLDSYELAQRLKAGNLTGFGSEEEALAALKYRTAIAVDMMSQSKAMLGAAGRTLRRARSEHQVTQQQLDQLGAIDASKLADVILSTRGNPEKLAKVGTRGTLAQIIDTGSGWLAANFLWGWQSQVINFATSAGNLVIRPGEKGLGASILRGIGKVRGDEEMMSNALTAQREALRETTYISSVVMDGWQSAIEAFKQGDSIMAPHATEVMNTVSRTGQGAIPTFTPINTIEDVYKNAFAYFNFGMTADLRFMGAVDEGVKQIRYRAVMMAKASVEAEKRGFKAGSKEYKEYISARVSQAYDDAGRATDQAALAEAKATTFQQDLVSGGETHWGALGQWYQNLTYNVPLLKIITPFVKTPVNLLRYGVRLTPGINLLQKEYFDALKGGRGFDEQARATGQMAMGIALASLGATLWSTGKLTGSGPANAKQKREWLAEGNRPWSIVSTNEKGQKSYLELSRWDPVAFPLVATGEFLSLVTSGHIKEDDQHSIAGSLVLTFAHLMKDKTYLRNLADTLDAFTDDGKLEKLPQRLAPGFMPFSSLFRQLNGDDYMREVYSVMDSWQARMPGASDSLPPVRDIFGDPVRMPKGFTSKQKHDGKLREALDEIYTVTGRTLEPPAVTTDHGQVDLRKVTLANGRNAYDYYQELAGHPKGMTPLKAEVEKLVSSPFYENLRHGETTRPGTKSNAISDLMGSYRRAAMDQMIGEDKGLQDLITLKAREQAKAGAAGKKNIPSAAVGGAMRPINSLLETFNLGSVPIPNTVPEK